METITKIKEGITLTGQATIQWADKHLNDYLLILYACFFLYLVICGILFFLLFWFPCSSYNPPGGWNGGVIGCLVY